MHHILNLLKGSNVRTLVENFAYLSLLQIAGYIFPLFTYPYLAHVIGVEGFGKIAFAAAIMVWIQAITDWGFNYTATRDVAANHDDKEQVARIFSDVTWARILLMCVSFLILCIVTFLVPYLREMWQLLLVTFLMIPGHILFPEWLFQGLEKMKYITWLNLISKSFFVVMVFLFIKDVDDYILQPLFIALGYMVSGIIGMYFIIVRYEVKLQPFSWKNTYICIKGSFDVFVNQLMPNLYNAFSVLLLGFWGGNIANGIFDAGKKLVDVGISFFSLLSRTFYPFLSRKIEKHAFYARLNILLSLFLSLFLFVLAPYCIDFLFADDFKEAVSVMRILSISIIFLTLSDIYGKNYLIIVHRERLLRNITFISSIVGFCISIPLVYHYGYIGAAVTLTMSRGLIGLNTFLGVCYIKKMHL